MERAPKKGSSLDDEKCHLERLLYIICTGITLE
jgi:hypothetical protein